MTRLLALLPPLEHAAMNFGRLADEIDGVTVVATADPDAGAAALPEIDVLVTIGPMMTPPAMVAALPAARRLRWAQSIGTGVDHLLGNPALAPDIAISNVRGIHGAQMAEAALAAMLALARDLPRAVRQQAEARWERYAPLRLAGGTVGILGVGMIAEALAPRLGALGLTVVGISGAPRATPGFDRVESRAELARVVAGLDWLILLTPYSAATHHIVDAAILAAMKPGACLVNLARGGVLDEAALLAALDAGPIAGAALDVFAAEPLPAASPLWAHPKVIVTPHLGGFHAAYADDVYEAVAANVRRYQAGGIAALADRVDGGRR